MDEEPKGAGMPEHFVSLGVQFFVASPIGGHQGDQGMGRVYFFGAWSPFKLGHHLYSPHGLWVSETDQGLIPWGRFEIDGVLQPTCYRDTLRRGWRWLRRDQGSAKLHHKEGWTALSWWDRTGDARMGSNSTIIAEGDFTSAQMIDLGRKHFAEIMGRQP